MSSTTRARKESETSGLGKLWFDLRFRRHRHRQLVGVLFVLFLTLVGTPTTGLVIAGAVLATMGMGVRLWASGVVMKDESLATSGPYGRVRHPLYVGNLLICAGFCLASGLWWSVPLALVYLVYFYPATIRQEDAKLRGLFPDEWDRWAAETRALVPRLRPFDGPKTTSWSFARSLKRNGEPLHVVGLAACLVWLWLSAPRA